MAKTKKGFLDGYKTYDTTEGFGNAESWQQAFNKRMSAGEARKILSGQTQTPDNILGVPQGAPEAEIKHAYRQLLQQWHPDKNPTNTEAAAAMTRLIIAAYTALTGNLSKNNKTK